MSHTMLDIMGEDIKSSIDQEAYNLVEKYQTWHNSKLQRAKLVKLQFTMKKISFLFLAPNLELGLHYIM